MNHATVMAGTAGAMSVISMVVLAFTPATAADVHPGVPRIGYLVFSSLTETPSPERAGFLSGLRELGYENGKNIVIEYRSAEGDVEALPFLAKDLVDLRVKAIVGFGSPVIRAAREASSTIPIVMLAGADPVRLGLVNSLARPGSNITGISLITTELGPKRLEILKQTAPNTKVVALVFDQTNSGAGPEVAAIAAAASRLGIQLIEVPIPDVADDTVLGSRVAAVRPDAILTIVDQRVAAYRSFLPRFATEMRIPAMFDWYPFVEAGGLMSYAPDLADMARAGAGVVDKILRGANPANLPIQQPAVIQFTINLRAAKSIGLRVPDRMLQRADRVIE